MRSDMALGAGTYLALEIVVAQERSPLAVEVSVVCWCKDGQFGIEFLRYRQGDRDRVRQFIATMPRIKPLSQRTQNQPSAAPAESPNLPEILSRNGTAARRLHNSQLPRTICTGSIEGSIFISPKTPDTSSFSS